MTIPKEIRADLARAKTHLQDNVLDRALESISLALRQINSLAHIPTQKNMDRQINSLLLEISNHPQMQIFLQHNRSEKNNSTLTYERGKEKVLATILQEFAKMLKGNKNEQDKINQDLQDKRLEELLNKARTAFSKKEYGIATSFLMRAAAEFDSNFKVLNYIGTILANAKLHLEAAKVFEQNIKCNTRHMESYTLAINNYILAKDYEKAERIFTLALRQFGGHPRTYGRMATLYLLWGKYTEAQEFSRMALKLDPEEKYALQVLYELEQIGSS